LQSGQNAVKLYPNNEDAHLCLGKAYDYLGYIDLSIKELEIAEKLKNKKEALGLHHNLDNDLLYYDEQLKKARYLNDKEGESEILSNIALIYCEQNNYDKALEYFNKSLQLTSNPDSIATIYSNIASVYLDKGDNDKVVEYYKKAIELSQKVGNYRNTAINMINLGAVYTNLKNFQDAQYYLQKGLLIVQKTGDRLLEANIYKYFGKLYSLQKQKGLAKEYFKKAYNLYKTTGYNKDAQWLYDAYLK